jgi:hypothetical protein
VGRDRRRRGDRVHRHLPDKEGGQKHIRPARRR